MRVLSLTALLGAFATLAALAVTAIAVARTAGAGFAGVALCRRWGHVIAGQVQVGQQCQGGCIDKVGRCIAGMVFRGAGLALAAFTAGLALAAFSTGLALTAAIAIAGRAITACLIAVFTVYRVHALWGCGGSLCLCIGYGACFGAALAATATLAVTVTAFAGRTTAAFGGACFRRAFAAFTTAGTAFGGAIAAISVAVAIAVAIAAAVALAAAASAFTTTPITAWLAGRGFCDGCRGRCGGCGCGWAIAHAEQAFEPGKEALLLGCDRGARRGRLRCCGGPLGCARSAGLGLCLGAGRSLWSWGVRQHALDHRGLLVGRLLRAA